MTTQSWPLLWYTSRTPTEEGQRHCAWARWAGYHGGRHGTGWRRRSLSVPLATGGAVHTGIEHLAGWLLDFQAKHHGMPPAAWLTHPAHLEVIAWAATEAASAYERKARRRGFAEPGVEGGSQQLGTIVEQLILEQRTLIEAQVWVWAVARLPNILAQYRILNSEREETIVLECTCGLGTAVTDEAIHKSRGCTGIVQQARADIILEGWEPSVRGKLIYEEEKTKASQNVPWEKAWEHSGQLLVNMEAASRRLGKPITEAQIVVLFKGWRGRDRNMPPEAPKYQHTPLVYGYHNPGGLNQPPDWQARYKWYDDYGKERRLGSTYQKHPIWLEDIPLPGGRDGASRVETWVTKYIQADQWLELMKTLGPFPRPTNRVPLALQSVIAEEQRWRADVEEARAAGAVLPSHPLVDAIFPRSWACTHFDGTPCEFAPICNREPGWEDPDSMGKYQHRRPHHEPERLAHEALGWTFEDEDAEGEEEVDW